MNVSMPTTSLVEWLDASAANFADHVAVEDFQGRSICYREMGELSRRLQATLLDANVDRSSRVGVLMRKSIDAVIAFQAILRCGAAYVPCDPRMPLKRAAFMLKDCQSEAVFVDDSLAIELQRELQRIGHKPILFVVPTHPSAGHAWRIEALAAHTRTVSVQTGLHDVAFMLYTSGSTGSPKAVLLTHGNIITFIHWCSGEFHATDRDRFAVHSPLHFSLPAFNLYIAWKHGAAAVLVDEDAARIPEVLAPFIETRRITVWFSTPTILSMLAESGCLQSRNLSSLRLVMWGGEAFPVPKLRSLHAQLSHPRYVQVLGSTETNIMTHYDLLDGMITDATTTIPIGKTCPHFKSRIIDESGNVASQGSDGELCLSGPGVTPGYWKGVDATSRAFFTDVSGTKWYRTGDIVRAQPDGNLVYRGRRDRMIKKRGNRIELSEIESCLYENPGVKEVGVVAIPDEALGVKVQAFVVRQESRHPTILELKAHCAKNLPLYMVPDTFTFRESLPRTSTGKIDFPTLGKSCDVTQTP